MSYKIGGVGADYGNHNLMYARIKFAVATLFVEAAFKTLETMSIYMIGYDLNKPGQNYENLFTAIKKLSNNWWHCLDSTWLIKSDNTAVSIRDALRPHIDASDELLVAKLSGEGAWAGFNEECSVWLKQNL
jgi:hypothetical protein